ncbi:MAG: molybdate ABC transporter substrate-binding protein [Clostridia bacterium]|nr:molybdate ABC transporter substrate-binding protein [Clostridia bacterium]
MKRALLHALALCMMVPLLIGCTVGQAEELIVIAAASLTEPLTELGGKYMAVHPGLELLFNFDSSGTLKTQIQEGADCDVFISAGQMQMDALEEQDMLLPDMRFDILENKVALVVPEGNPAGIYTYKDMISGLQDGSILMAMGGADVPVGQYTREILAYFGLTEDDLAAAGSVTYGSNVKEVTTQVCEALVDCGVIYQTDVCSAGLTVVDTATEEMCGRVVYPVTIMESCANPDAARDFLDYLTGDVGDAEFASVGFTPLN